MLVQGEIKGLKKGTLFLQKVANNQFITVDSVFVEENGNYNMGSNENPDEMYYLSFEKEAEKNNRIFLEMKVLSPSTQALTILTREKVLMAPKIKNC